MTELNVPFEYELAFLWRTLGLLEYFNDDKSSLYSDKSDMETICLPQKNRLSQLILDLDLYIYQMKY